MQTARRKRRKWNRSGSRGRMVATLIAAVVLVAAIVIAASSGGGSSPKPRRLESMFQDDQMLVYASTPAVVQTLQTLKALGVDRLRITVKWQDVAPAPEATTPPHFDAAQPGAYTSSGWSRYDRIDYLAARYGLKLDFDVTGPGPLWAAEANAHDAQVAAGYGLNAAAFAHVANNFGLSANAFGQFVQAVGRRYSGRYRIPFGSAIVTLPRVSFWSVWNEPNQPGWLAPQFQQVNGTWYPLAPELYRDYVDAADAALHATGHGKDTLLIGELAPEGCVPGGTGGSCAIYPKIDQPLPPVNFIRSMYCLGASGHPLRGAAATVVGCPAAGTRAAFVKANPALFDATAFAHHPYSFSLPPNLPLPEPQFVPLENLTRLEHELDHVFKTYGVGRKIPLYLTEYGYETDPPNPTPKGQTLTHQSTWLNEAVYMAARNPRVEGLSQFLLVDTPPNTKVPSTSPAYWSTFQTGLEFLNGTPKPSFYSYALPIFLPDGGAVTRGEALPVWAMLRLAPNGKRQRALVQWGATRSSFRVIARVTTSDPSGIFQTRVHVPASGYLRVAWAAPGGAVHYSRDAVVTVGP